MKVACFERYIVSSRYLHRGEPYECCLTPEELLLNAHTDCGARHDCHYERLPNIAHPRTMILSNGFCLGTTFAAMQAAVQTIYLLLSDLWRTTDNRRLNRDRSPRGTGCAVLSSRFVARSSQWWGFSWKKLLVW